MCACDCVCLADDRDDSCPRLQLAQHIQIQVFIQTAEDGTTSFDDISLLASVSNVLVQANWIQDKEDTVDVGVFDTRRSHDLLLLAERVLEFGLEEGGDDGQLEVNDVLLQTFRIPDCNTDPLSLYFCLKEFRSEGRVFAANGCRRRRRGVGSLPSGERKRSAEELDEGRLAGALSADDEDARKCQLNSLLSMCATYLNGVGSFLLLTRRGLLTVLIWLLA